MVEGGPRILDVVTDDGAPMKKGKLFRENYFSAKNLSNGIILPLTLEFVDDLVAVRLEESREFLIERIQVLFRSVEFPEMAIERMHEVDLVRERQEDTEDAEGPRDSGAQARRLSPRCQEGREGQALNFRQREEVASRTERGHPGGDYSARHTRSGIPEDA